MIPSPLDKSQARKLTFILKPGLWLYDFVQKYKQQKCLGGERKCNILETKQGETKYF